MAKCSRRVVFAVFLTKATRNHTLGRNSLRCEICLHFLCAMQRQLLISLRVPGPIVVGVNIYLFVRFLEVDLRIVM